MHLLRNAAVLLLAATAATAATAAADACAGALDAAGLKARDLGEAEAELRGLEAAQLVEVSLRLLNHSGCAAASPEPDPLPPDGPDTPEARAEWAALRAFKAAADPDNVALPSWRVGLPFTPVCDRLNGTASSWRGILCQSGSVILVSTFGSNFRGFLPDDGVWDGLPRLQYLDIGASPTLAGTLPASWARLPELRDISLRHTSISGTLPSAWQNLAQLRAVVVSESRVSGTLPNEWAALTALDRVDVSRSRVSGTLPAAWARGVPLGAVDVSNSPVGGTLPPEWGGGSTADLHSFAAEDSALSGTLPPEWGGLASLREFKASRVSLSGTLPPEWGALEALATLSLEDGSISGALPSAWGGMSALGELQMNNQRLNGSLPAGWASLARLGTLNMRANDVRGTLPPEWEAMRNLYSLQLDSNEISGSLPPAWARMTRLQFFDCENNLLDGPLPAEWANATALLALILNRNRIGGTLPSAWGAGALPQLGHLDLAGNRVSGTLPREWAGLPRLNTVQLNDNAVSGSLPPGWGDSPSLAALYAARNRLSGELPAAWSRRGGNFSTLLLEDNSVSGTLPDAWHALAGLRTLSLAGNAVSGALPPSWSAMLGAAEFDLSFNRLNGTLPRGWGAMAALRTLELTGNRLSGTLPPLWGAMGARVDAVYKGASLRLAQNSLSGTLPAEWSYPGVRFLELTLADNALSGTLQPSLPVTLESLYVDRNRLSGTLPADTWYCSHGSGCEQPRLQVLHAGDNLISGTLPVTLGVLNGLAQLVVPRNRLGGSLAPGLPFDRLSVLDVSGNAALDACPPPPLFRSRVAARVGLANTSGDAGSAACTASSRPWVQASGEEQRVFAGAAADLVCPTWLVAGGGAVLLAGPEFLGYEQCRCPDGFLWTRAAAACEPCPLDGERARCDPYVLAPRHCVLGNHYPAAPGTGALPASPHDLAGALLLQCRRPGVCNTGAAMCADETFSSLAGGRTPADDAASPGLGFECAAGYDDEALLCSRCLPDYWQSGDACLECHASFRALVPVAFVLSVAALVAALWWQSGQPPSGYRTLAIALFWVQVTQLLEASAQVHGEHTSTSTWAWVGAARAVLGSWALFRPLAAQCVSHGLQFVAQSYVVLAAPAAVALVGGAAAWLARSARVAFVAAFLLVSMFLPVVTRALQAFPCESQAGAGAGTLRYLSAAPYVGCDDPRLRGLRAVAGLVLALYAAPLLAGLWVMARRGGAAAGGAPSRLPAQELEAPLLEEEDEAAGAGAPPPRAGGAAGTAAVASLADRLLLCDLRDPAALWWWPVAGGLGRGLALSLVVGLVPPTSALLPVGVFVVLVASALAQARFRPARHAVDAALELAVLLAATAVYLLSIVGGAAAAQTSSGDSAAVRALVSLVHAAMIVVLGVCLAAGPWVSQKLAAWRRV